jgi:hypothetical protein
MPQSGLTIDRPCLRIEYQWLRKPIAHRRARIRADFWRPSPRGFRPSRRRVDRSAPRGFAAQRSGCAGALSSRPEFRHSQLTIKQFRPGTGCRRVRASLASPCRFSRDADPYPCLRIPIDHRRSG